MSAVTDSGVEKIPIWSGTNLLVEFDEAGTVKKSATLSDKRIIAELQRILAEHPQTISATASLDVGAKFYPDANNFCYAVIKISKTAVELSRKEGQVYGSKCPVGVTAPVQQFAIASFKPPAGEFDPGPVDSIRVTLHFSQKTAFGTDIPASLKVNDLVSLLEFAGAPRPNARS